MNVDKIKFIANGKFIRSLVEAVESLPDDTLPEGLVLGGRLRADASQHKYCQISCQDDKDRFKF